MPARDGDGGEALRARQRMPSLTFDREIRELGVDVEEGRAGNVAGEIELTAQSGLAKLPAAVHELVPHYPVLRSAAAMPAIERSSGRRTRRARVVAAPR